MIRAILTFLFVLVALIGYFSLSHASTSQGPSGPRISANQSFPSFKGKDGRTFLMDQQRLNYEGATAMNVRRFSFRY
jgi:hypothetical protein